jgi:RimJ/RimL family protein N-acetyltransferase
MRISFEMNHSVSIAGYNTRLRPVRILDAEFILRLRNMPHVVGTVGDTVPEVAGQRRWIQDYFQRNNDYYFIIESLLGHPWGTIGIYNFTAGGAEWGRWIILPGIMAAVPSAVLVHQLAFQHFGLAELRGEVVSGNSKVLSFQRRFGCLETGIVRQNRIIQGKPVEMVRFVMSRIQWTGACKRLNLLAEVAGRSLEEVQI